jgi:hypothetical protein
MDITTIIARAKNAANAHYDAYYGFQQMASQQNEANNAIYRVKKMAETLTADEQKIIESILEDGRKREAEAQAKQDKAIAEWKKG